MHSSRFFLYQYTTLITFYANRSCTVWLCKQPHCIKGCHTFSPVRISSFNNITSQAQQLDGTASTTQNMLNHLQPHTRQLGTCIGECGTQEGCKVGRPTRKDGCCIQYNFPLKEERVASVRVTNKWDGGAAEFITRQSIQDAARPDTSTYQNLISQRAKNVDCRKLQVQTQDRVM